MDILKNFSADSRLLQKLKGQVVLVKYGGNAMVDDEARNLVLDQVGALSVMGILPVVVHGGGPVIKQLLEDVGLESEFIGGHRKTDSSAMRYVEMALNGQVNGEIVKGLNRRKLKAVGLSGKDAAMVRAERRIHEVEIDGNLQQADLGYVGNVVSVDTSLIRTLLENHYIPVLAPIGVGDDGMDYNINADMFAGHLAGALKASSYVALTDVDGLMTDIDDPDSLIRTMTAGEVKKMMGTVIQGGMIPKIESALTALSLGVKKAHIINGTKEGTLLNELLTDRTSGTTIES